MRFNILPNELSCSQFYKCIDNCDVRIPMKDVEIHDGEIEVSLKHMLFTTGICWDDFKSWCRSDDDYEFLVIHEDELKPIFNEALVKFLSVADSRPSIHVKTYISKKNFKYVFLSKGRLKNRLYEHETSLYGHDYLMIPHQYLLNDFNEGFSILLNIHKDCYDEVLTSDAYEFPKSIQDEIISKIKLYKRKCKEEYKNLIPSLKKFKSLGIFHNIASTLYSDQENEIYLKSLLFKILSNDYVPKVRKVTDYYLGRECGGYYKGEARIYRFIEDFSHYSDYNGFHENGVSHAIVKYKDDTIIIIPSIKKYSTYVFTIDTTSNCIDAATVVLIKYFSSTLLYNKRQLFRLNNLFKVFGIRSFRKVSNNI